MTTADFDYMSGEQYLEEILRQAIRFEEESYALYSNAIQITTIADARVMLQDLASQELGHKKRLQRLQEKGVAELAPVVKTTEAQDLKLAEYLQVPSELDQGADLQDVLLVAMQREKSTREFYLKLGQLTEEGPAKNLFDLLAEEELRHKNWVESLYEQLVYQEF
ncbi:MAG: ferritin family protein [Chloroflexi bacterium]|nr:ferritin family protein [Chloroflexota bacterium]